MFSFQLPDGNLAHYPWGSSVIRLSYLAPVTSRSLTQFMVAYMLPRADWETDAGFRAHVSLGHEIVHYYQDLLTGVGHWDFLIRQKRAPELLSLSRDVSRLGKALSLRVSEVKASLLDSLLYVPSDRLPAQRRRALESRLFALGGTSEDVESVEIESLFEAEAAATSFVQILNLPKDEEQSDIARRNAAFYQPHEMPSLYSATWYQFVSILREHLESKYDPLTIAEIACHYVRLFVDLSLAHPSPRLIDNRKLERELYEPGIKLLYLTRAYHALPDNLNDAFIEAFGNNPFDAEELLLAHCEQRYVSSREIYKDWLDVFETQLKIDDDPLIRLRADACRQRLENPEAAKDKTLLNTVEMKVPLFAFTSTGIVSYLFGRVVDLDTPEWNRLHRSLLSTNRDASIVAYFLDETPFVCPIAEAQLCDAATPECLAGIRRDEQFPASQLCEVRADLSEQRFVMKAGS